MEYRFNEQTMKDIARHGGSLYIADADTPITGSPADGSVYIRVSGTTSLTVEFITSLSGYVWNPVYNAMTNGIYTLLPYMIVKAGATWTRFNFNPNNQVFGEMKATSLDTGHGANELYAMNQNVRTTDSPTFTQITTTNGPNKPVDNNDASMPSVGIGGFSYATASAITDGTYPSITIGSGGTWVYIAFSTRSGSTSSITVVGRLAGGSSVQGLVSGGGSALEAGLLYVIAWRIA